MKANNPNWKKHLTIGIVTAIVPLTALAHGPGPESMPDAWMDAAPRHAGPMMPPPEMFPPMPPPSLMRPLPYLRGLELAENQQEMVFELMLDRAPFEWTQAREASNTMNALHQLAASDRFDTGKARTLAVAHAQAIAKLALMNAELEAKVRSLLTPEQRKRIADDMTRPGPDGPEKMASEAGSR